MYFCTIIAHIANVHPNFKEFIFLLDDTIRALQPTVGNLSRKVVISVNFFKSLLQRIRKK